MVLAGCLAQAPAPVALYGTSEGAGSAGVHTVTPGENLWSISNRYDIVMRDIVVSNDMRAPFVLHAGQRIKLPPPRTYRVRRGDSLYTVSRLYGVSSSELARLNRLRAPYVIRKGQVLKLPSVTAKTMPAVVQTASAARPAPLAPVEKGQIVPPAASPPPSSQGEGVKKEVSAVTRAKIPSKTPKRSSSKFLKPVDGTVVSSYGPKKNGLHNDGVNIRAVRGTAVKAAENGVVVYAGDEIKGSGNLILIRHEDRWMTAYAHLGDIRVKRGDVLKRGDVIGTVGSTGSVDSPQLHFEVRRGTEALNPARYMES
ncbi:MAG: LysM peptidoglycan-binding domain-containing M23 family metallopeptidase [Alphaproteobacteria bacterium]